MLRITLFVASALMWLAAPAQAQTEARAELKVLIGIDPSDVESLLISTSAISSARNGAKLAHSVVRQKTSWESS